MGQYDILNTPFQIGPVTIKNRFVVLPLTMGALSYDAEGGYSENFMKYMELRAEGGFGLIIPGASVTDYHVDPSSATKPNVNTNLHWQEKAKELVQRVHEKGAKIFCQITMGMGRNYPYLYGPSENPVWLHPDMKSPAMTLDQIHQKIDDMIDAAAVAQACGYDGVEVHAIHWGYLLDEMAMSFYNHRTDAYGGSLENRLRAAKEILGGIRERCGCSFPVGMRLGLRSFMKDYDTASLTGEEEVGRTLEEGIAIAKLLEYYGYDYLNVDTGNYDAFYYACPPIYNPQGFMIPLAAAAKAVVDIPIIAGGRMQNYDLAAAAITAGEIDAIGLGRASLADPEYPNKVISGAVERIRPCIGCNMGCLRRLVETGEPASCAVNPQAAREGIIGLKPGTGKKKIAVIGGGVAGMEAARTAALRGYDITLFEKSDHLGGHLVEAGAHSFKTEVAQLNIWYQQELAHLPILVHLGQEASIQSITAEKPDAVILATGSIEAKPAIPGLDQGLSALEAIHHPEKIGQTVVVIGGGLVGCEIALDEANQGKDITIVEALEDIMAAGGAAAPYPNQQMIRDLFAAKNVTVLTSTRLTGVTAEGAIVEMADGRQKLLPADTVITALGFHPAPNLKEALKALDVPIYEIGDATGAGTIMKAIWDAYDVANRI